MSQTSSDSPDGLPPSRQDPPAARSQKDSSELDLWDFDDSTPASSNSERSSEAEAQQPPAIANSPAEIKIRPRSVDLSPREGGLPNRKNLPIRPKSSTQSPSRPIDLNRKTVDEIGELENEWAEVGEESAPSKPSHTTTSGIQIQPTENLQDHSENKKSEIPEESAEPSPETEEAPQEKDTPKAPSSAEKETSARKLLHFNKGEKIGLAAFTLILLTSLIVLFSLAKSRLPTESGEEEKISFPVKGQHVTIKSVTSFWREPIAGKDVARRETLLIPVAQIETQGNPAAIRVLFRNDKGEVIGDTSTRSTSQNSLEIAATAGFSETGKHAAYRTGETPSWKIEISEAASVDSPSQEFRPLLSVPISPDLH